MKAKYLVLLGFFVLFSCDTSDEESEYVNLPLNLEVPSNFPPSTYNTINNPITEKGFELGKKLFFCVFFILTWTYISE